MGIIVTYVIMNDTFIVHQSADKMYKEIANFPIATGRVWPASILYIIFTEHSRPVISVCQISLAVNLLWIDYQHMHLAMNWVIIGWGNDFTPVRRETPS